MGWATDLGLGLIARIITVPLVVMALIAGTFILWDLNARANYHAVQKVPLCTKINTSNCLKSVNAIVIEKSPQGVRLQRSDASFAENIYEPFISKMANLSVGGSVVVLERKNRIVALIDGKTKYWTMGQIGGGYPEGVGLLLLSVLVLGGINYYIAWFIESKIRKRQGEDGKRLFLTPKERLGGNKIKRIAYWALFCLFSPGLYLAANRTFNAGLRIGDRYIESRGTTSWRIQRDKVKKIKRIIERWSQVPYADLLLGEDSRVLATVSGEYNLEALENELNVVVTTGVMDKKYVRMGGGFLWSHTVAAIYSSILMLLALGYVVLHIKPILF